MDEPVAALEGALSGAGDVADYEGASTFTWTAPAALNTNAATDVGDDWRPQIATDSMGNWVAVWTSWDSLGGAIGTDGDILFSRSTDAGQTWTAPAALNTNAAIDSDDDQYPQVTTDSMGNWVAVWTSWNSGSGGLGTDGDILFSRSTDAGQTWTYPAVLNTNAATDSGGDVDAQVTTDSMGNWVVVWASMDTLGGTIDTDYDILFSRSTDAGQTWTDPAALNGNAATDSWRYDQFPQVTTDLAGNWVAVWESDNSLGGTIGTDYDILFARSTDAGQTWTAPVALNTNAAIDSAPDVDPQITTDSVGNWVAVWESYDSLDGTIGTDGDILFSRSTDAGQTWTPPAALNGNAGTDGGWDWRPQVAADSAGNWIGVWESEDSLGGTIGTESDILFSRSIDAGQSWTYPAALNTNAATDPGRDLWPKVTTDSMGNWIAIWWSYDSLGGTIGTDRDILFSRFATDVNDPPTDIALAVDTVVEKTDTSTGYAVGVLSGTDPDTSAPFNSLSFAVQGGADSAKFSVDGSNYLVLTDGILDFEKPTDADSDGVYEVTVRVTDGGTPGLTYDEALTVTVTDVNERPTADVGGPYFVDEGRTITLDASGSTDPDSDILQHQWDLDGDDLFGETGSAAARGDEVGIYPTFSAVGLDGPVRLAVSLRVVDDSGLSDQDAAEIWITEPLGPVDFLELNDLDPSLGDLWYSLETTHEGFLTIVSLNLGGTVTLCDENGNPLLPGASQRVDWQVADDERYYFKLSGSGSNVDLRLANLVSHTGTNVTVYGTADEDLFEFDATASRLVTINGVPYHFTDAEATSVSFHGAAAADTAVLNGNNQNETAKLWPGRGRFNGDGYRVAISNVETVTAIGGEGADVAVLFGNPNGTDTFSAGPHLATLSGDGYSNQVVSFRHVSAVSTPSNEDTAYLHDDPSGDDRFKGWPDEARLYGKDYCNRAISFRNVYGYGAPLNNDVAVLFDNPDGDDTFLADPHLATLSGEGYSNKVALFRYVNAYSTSGNEDTAYLHDDPNGDDTFKGWPTKARLHGEGYSYFNQAWSFRNVYSYGTPGNKDVAVLFDNPDGIDTLLAGPHLATLSGEGYSNKVASFRYVNAIGTSGNDDTAYLYDDPNADDRFKAWPDEARLIGPGYQNQAISFRNVYAYGTPGNNDVAGLTDSGSDDTFEAWPNLARLFGPGHLAEAASFRKVRAFATTGGTDAAWLYGSAEKDTLIAKSSFSKLRGPGFYSRAVSFDRVHAYPGAGRDVAVLYDAIVETGIVDPPPSTVAIAWLQEFAKLRLRSETPGNGETVTQVVDQLFTAYWE